MKTYELPEKLDTEAAIKFYAEIAEMDSDVSLNAGKSKSIGALFAQLLISMKRTLENSGRSFEITNSENLLPDLRLLGVLTDLETGEKI